MMQSGVDLANGYVQRLLRSATGDLTVAVIVATSKINLLEANDTLRRLSKEPCTLSLLYKTTDK